MVFHQESWKIFINSNPLSFIPFEIIKFHIHPRPCRCGAPCGGRGSGGCGRTACGSAARLPRRWVGRRRALPAPSPRAALRGTALWAPERRVRLAAAPCAGSADAERGRLRYPPEDAAAAPSLCIPRLVRCGVSLAADCHSVTCGRRRDLSKKPETAPSSDPWEGSQLPHDLQFTEERSTLLNGDTRLLAQIQNLAEILAKGLRGCRCLLPLFKLSVHFVVLLPTIATETLKKKNQLSCVYL